MNAASAFTLTFWFVGRMNGLKVFRELSRDGCHVFMDKLMMIRFRKLEFTSVCAFDVGIDGDIFTNSMPTTVEVCPQLVSLFIRKETENACEK